MTPYFNTGGRVSALLYWAGQWRGTPWCPNSSVMGLRGGVACHNLPRALLIRCGALPQDFPQIIATPKQANERSLFAPFLDGRPEFERADVTKLQPGDMVGLWLGRDALGRRVHHEWTNHVGVMLTNGWFIHTLAHKTTDYDQINCPPWSQRIKAAWRPVQP